MKLGFASDHAGYDLKERLKAWAVVRGYQIVDFGTYNSISVDYPDFVHKAVAGINQWERLILVCGSGIGVSMAANRYANIRCALVTSADHAKLSREHNNANTIAFGQRLTDPLQAEYFLKIFLETPFLGLRHKNRIKKISKNVFSPRASNELRLISFKTQIQTHVDGSCLIHLGDTQVLCSVDIKAKKLTEEHEYCKTSVAVKYTILPHKIDIQTNKKIALYATHQKNKTNIKEIISRSLDSAINFQLLKNKIININCYIINDSGNVMGATISCAWLAMALAFKKLKLSAALIRQVAAVEVGILSTNNITKDKRFGSVLDLEKSEDSRAIVKYNVVATCNNVNIQNINTIFKNQIELFEVQLISEVYPTDEIERMRLIDIGLNGCQTMINHQCIAMLEKD